MRPGEAVAPDSAQQRSRRLCLPNFGGSAGSFPRRQSCHRPAEPRHKSRFGLSQSRWLSRPVHPRLTGPIRPTHRHNAIFMPGAGVRITVRTPSGTAKAVSIAEGTLNTVRRRHPRTAVLAAASRSGITRTTGPFQNIVVGCSLHCVCGAYRSTSSQIKPLLTQHAGFGCGGFAVALRLSSRATRWRGSQNCMAR